ncbi:hypothetical protein MTR67_026346 [Solanum verrucosum]|uniref:Uncharacterized protein n=1 Tax=Solanum verrucosum TaxID=315347 RepID=A0AAF0TUD4_SOLVR|nr:hypothetical protein MTR67_026346 [Solanum verrucosum]
MRHYMGIDAGPRLVGLK